MAGWVPGFVRRGPVLEALHEVLSGEPFEVHARNGPIAVQGPAKNEGESVVCLMKLDGSERREVPLGYVADYYVSVSPDGARIAVLRNLRDGGDFVLRLHVIDADSGKERPLTGNLQEHRAHVAWSPDGSRIAVATCAWVSSPPGPGVPPLSHYEQNGLFVVMADGSEGWWLTYGMCHQPAWSPDGSRVAFARYEDDHPAGIYLIDADGHNETRLTTTEEDCFPVWSPDGRYIAYGTPPAWRNAVVSTDGSYQSPLCRARVLGPWSPDGTMILLVEQRGQDAIFTNRFPKRDIHVLTATGKMRLTRGGRSASPLWSPDGTKIAFERGDRICAINRDGSGLTTLPPFSLEWNALLAWLPEAPLPR